MTLLPLRTALTIVAVSTIAACSGAPGEATDTTEAPIIGGVEAVPGAWPGAVALYGSARLICGGTLVADEWVLTAAHCLNPWQPGGGVGKVVVGRHRLSSSEGQTFTVRQFFRPAQLSCNDSGICDHDVALLRLSARSSAPKATLISAAQLGGVVPGVDTMAVGWGYTSEGAGAATSDVLREVSVPLISQDTCRAAPEYRPLLTDNMLCTNAPDAARGSCRADSGSPLFVTLDGKPVQIGLTSWGQPCARPDSPTVYTRLGNYLEWMRTTSGGAINP